MVAKLGADIFKVSHPHCVGEHSISKTAVEIVFNNTVVLKTISTAVLLILGADIITYICKLVAFFNRIHKMLVMVPNVVFRSVVMGY